jgi:hypothetical protein
MAAAVGEADFPTVQRLVRWHYQWVVLDDFLRQIVNEKTYTEVLPHEEKRTDVFVDPPDLRLYRPRYEAFLPIEFSAAAYRFGHSMVRRRYRLNRRPGDRFATGPLEILGQRKSTHDLRGFRRPRVDWGIEWELFFERISDASKLGLKNINRVQPALKIDTTLSNPLSRLPAVEANPPNPSVLAQRNLIRGWRLGLPSGQAVACAMRKEPIPEALLKIGPDQKPLTDISPKFAGNAPLWIYILAEAQQDPYGGNKLGPVGGRIVMETMVGLMMQDGYSFLRQDPSWPDKKGFRQRKFGMAELIKKAMQA